MKTLYRTRITTKKGAYRVREFRSSKNAIAHAKKLANEGGYGYVEMQSYVAGMSRVTVIYHTECTGALNEEVV